MTASALDRRVQFWRATLVDDGLSHVEEWAKHGAPCWALRQDVSDGEKWRAAELQASITTRFQVRSSEFTREITPRDRIECEGQTFEITGIKQAGGRRQFIEITAARRTDGA